MTNEGKRLWLSDVLYPHINLPLPSPVSLAHPLPLSLRIFA